YLFNYQGTTNVKNEETWSLETGYTAKLLKTLTLLLNAYFQRFEDMVGYTTTTSLVGGLPVSSGTIGNIDAADSYGVEIELKKTFTQAIFSTWYAYNGFDADSLGRFRAYGPARHKIGLRGRLQCGRGWTLNSNYRYTNTTPSLVGGGSVPAKIPHANHRLDLTVIKSFNEERGEWVLGVSDICNETNGPHLGLSDLTGHETPGRIIFTRMRYKFQ
ncbi:MAG: TonB-dependent receptor, partial [Chlorobiales bacterium]|nr:TonB-dependent receptor [Chlorobiales bacterium]